MCEPISMSIMAAATLGQGVLGYQAAGAEADMMENQSDLGVVASKRAAKQGLRSEESFRSQIRQFQGEQRAAIGASGIVGSEGSAAAIQDDTAVQGELDALTVRNNAVLEAWGIRTDAQQSAIGARLRRYSGRGTLLTSSLQAGAYTARAIDAA